MARAFGATLLASWLVFSGFGPLSTLRALGAASTLLRVAAGAAIFASATTAIAPTASTALGQFDQLNAPIHLARELSPATVVASRDHGDSGSFRARAPGPADAVRIGRDIPRHAEVDHVADVLDIKSARCNVGCDEALDLFRAERGHHARARCLVVAAVQRLAWERHPLQLANQLIDVGAPVSEDEERLLGRRVFDQTRQCQPLVVVVDLHPILRDVVDGRDTFGGCDLERVRCVVARQAQ